MRVDADAMGRNDGPKKGAGKKKATFYFLLIAGAGFFFPFMAQAVTFPLPSIRIGVEEATGPRDVAIALEVLALLTILTLAPAILVLMTSFTRIVVVFHFLRQAIGIQSSPPNQVVIGLALFMTFFIMKPVWTEVYENALDPYLEDQITYQEAFANAEKPIREFMLVNTREKDLALFIKVAGADKPENRDSVSLLHLIPAFVISELKTAFIIGFVIYVPFLIIDMVVASVLLAMGMMMLPPVMISLPFKLMLFVLVDGWHLIAGSLIRSFAIP
ncbi:flagellar biosynthetic protein FliP [Desulfobotulus alkaliphilus]|uniref:Flagellar biosynthetic protein FliP n=2 Tax=Desulfobotulus alkaliphilus TaxID=622671 RepID=A0A562RTG2_9BACT|nr:flagellar type III secretion system pore protein FliP [Desulfobotulus alkaliphilus]TWI72405.1 flagellar biosynthetic protein FliP [Desulfobotulus alkaliphilus]